MKITEIILEAAKQVVDLDPADANFLVPKTTIKAYKLFRVDHRHPGKFFPLFVDADRSMKIGVWYEARIGDSAKDPKTGSLGVKSKIGKLAMRPGWHAGDLPIATHIGGDRKPNEKGKMAPSTRPDDQVWAEVEMPADVDWQEEANRRALRATSNSKVTGLKKGDIRPDTAHITDQIPVGGHYRYKTNPNMTGNWIISGAMKITRILSDEEVIELNKKSGVSDLPRSKPFDPKRYGF
jgi:hypothetical protein